MEFVVCTVFLVGFLFAIAIGYELAELRGMGAVILGTALLVMLLAYKDS